MGIDNCCYEKVVFLFLLKLDWSFLIFWDFIFLVIVLIVFFIELILSIMVVLIIEVKDMIFFLVILCVNRVKFCILINIFVFLFWEIVMKLMIGKLRWKILFKIK